MRHPAKLSNILALSWIKAIDKEFKAFVENRLGEIRNNKNIENWSYCPTQFNPADFITCWSY